MIGTDIVKLWSFFISPPIYTYDQEKFENNILEGSSAGYQIQSYSHLINETKLRTVAKLEVDDNGFVNCTHTNLER